MLNYNDNIPQDMRFTYAENFDSYKDFNLIIGHHQKPVMPQMQDNMQDVPGMYGNIYTGTDYGGLTFHVPATIMAYDETTYNLSLENIRSVLINGGIDRGKEFPIIFGDRPEVTYYVHLTNISSPSFLTSSDWQAHITLTFVASQPYGYLSQQNVELHGGLPIQVDGNAPTDPIYTIRLNKDVTQLGFTNATDGGEYVATGYQVDADNTDDQGNKISNKEPLVVNEPATNLSFWDYGSKAKDLETAINPDSIIDGEIGEYANWGIGVDVHNVQDKNRHDPNTKHTTLNYGDPTKHRDDGGDISSFYGPMAVHQDFSNPTNDWQLMINLRNQKFMNDFEGSRAMGDLSIYLLGENHQRRGKIWIHSDRHGTMPRMGIQLGDKNNHVELVGSKGTIGPEKIEGADHKQHEMWVNGANQTSTLYSIQYYKQAVTNAKSKKKATRKRSRKKRKTSRKIFLGSGLSVQAYQGALSKARLIEKKHHYNAASGVLADRIRESARLSIYKVKKRKKKKGGRSRVPKANNQKARSKYKNKKKQYNSRVSPHDHQAAPSGTHWVNKHDYIGHKEIDYNNSDLFSDFDGDFFLRKVGKTFKFWIKVDSSKYGADPDPICEYSYSDDDERFNFPLTSVAAHFSKHNIAADNSQYPHSYTQVHMGVGALKYWNIIDGGNHDKRQPKVIAHSGEIITIDTGKMKVYKDDGTDLTKITSFASTFPPLLGGIPNNVNFYPTPGTDCDVTCSYIPRIK